MYILCCVGRDESNRRAVNGVNEEKGSGGGRGTCRLSQGLDSIDTRVWEAGHRPVLSRVSPNCCLRFLSVLFLHSLLLSYLP